MALDAYGGSMGRPPALWQELQKLDEKLDAEIIRSATLEVRLSRIEKTLGRVLGMLIALTVTLIGAGAAVVLTVVATR